MLLLFFLALTAQARRLQNQNVPTSKTCLGDWASSMSDNCAMYAELTACQTALGAFQVPESYVGTFTRGGQTVPFASTDANGLFQELDDTAKAVYSDIDAAHVALYSYTNSAGTFRITSDRDLIAAYRMSTKLGVVLEIEIELSTLFPTKYPSTMPSLPPTNPPVTTANHCANGIGSLTWDTSTGGNYVTFSAGDTKTTKAGGSGHNAFVRGAQGWATGHHQWTVRMWWWGTYGVAGGSANLAYGSSANDPVFFATCDSRGVVGYLGYSGAERRTCPSHTETQDFFFDLNLLTGSPTLSIHVGTEAAAFITLNLKPGETYYPFVHLYHDGNGAAQLCGW